MPHVVIHFCPVWSGYDRRAASLAAELERRPGVSAEAVRGETSQFDVVVDGTLVFSKQERERFPEPAEIPT